MTWRIILSSRNCKSRQNRNSLRLTRCAVPRQNRGFRAGRISFGGLIMPRWPSLDERLWSRIERNRDGQCWVWHGFRNVGGYGRISVKSRQTLVHRLVYEMLIGPIPDGLCVLHTCDNPPCVNPAHLHLGDRRENLLEAYARKCHPGQKSENNGNAKLTHADVEAIREIYALGGETHVSLARWFGIKRSEVGYILRRDHWKG